MEGKVSRNKRMLDKVPEVRTYKRMLDKVPDDTYTYIDAEGVRRLKKHYDILYQYAVTTCKWCGTHFEYEFNIDNGYHHNYCTDICMIAANQEKRKQKKKAVRKTFNKCLVCGKPITQSERGKIKKYCSNKCKKVIYNAKIQVITDEKNKADFLLIIEKTKKIIKDENLSLDLFPYWKKLLQ